MKCPTTGRIKSVLAAMTPRHTPFLLPLVTTFLNTSFSFVPAYCPSPIPHRWSSVPFVLPAFGFRFWSAAVICTVAETSTSVTVFSSTRSTSVLTPNTGLIPERTILASVSHIHGVGVVQSLRPSSNITIFSLTCALFCWRPTRSKMSPVARLEPS